MLEKNVKVTGKSGKEYIIYDKYMIPGIHGGYLESYRFTSKENYNRMIKDAREIRTVKAATLEEVITLIKTQL